MIWAKYALRDIGRIVTGKTPPTANPEYYGGTIPFLTPSDMDGRRRVEQTLRTLTHAGAAKVSAAFITEPAVSVSCIGSDMGKTILVDGPFVSNQQINSIILGDAFDRNFVYYHLSARKTEIRSLASGAAQPILNKSDFGKLEILAPSKPEQVQIADIFKALDDKIELNRQMNETLDATAQAIFYDWFVDFGPIRRKAAGETDPEIILDGLPCNKSLADSFPDSFGLNGLPDGWKMRELSRFGTLKAGKYLPKEEFVRKGPIPVFGGVGEMGRTDKTNASGYVISVGRVGSNCGHFVAHRGDAWINNNAAFFDLNATTKAEWFFYALRNLNLLSLRKGAAQPFISNADIARLTVIYPGQRILDHFQDILIPLVELMEANTQESQSLIAMRDALLVKLISGEIRLNPLKD